MENLKKQVKPSGHFINHRGAEIVVGGLVFLVGCLLLWDAFDGRDKPLPWPLGAILPW